MCCMLTLCSFFTGASVLARLHVPVDLDQMLHQRLHSHRPREARASADWSFAAGTGASSAATSAAAAAASFSSFSLSFASFIFLSFSVMGFLASLVSSLPPSPSSVLVAACSSSAAAPSTFVSPLSAVSLPASAVLSSCRRRYY